MRFPHSLPSPQVAKPNHAPLRHPSSPFHFAVRIVLPFPGEAASPPSPSSGVCGRGRGCLYVSQSVHPSRSLPVHLFSFSPSHRPLTCSCHLPLEVHNREAEWVSSLFSLASVYPSRRPAIPRSQFRPGTLGAPCPQFSRIIGAEIRGNHSR
jgi:hypothetical protein